MKFCFLINDAPFLSEFLGKIYEQMLKNEDEAVVVVNTKIAEYTKERYFPSRTKFISKVDWCVKNFNKASKEFGNLSWREFFPAFGRFQRLKWDYRYSVDTVSQLYQFFDFVFQNEKPDVLLGEPPAGLFGEIGYYFAKKNGVPFLGLTDSRVNIAIYDSESTDSRFEKAFKELSDSDISENERVSLNALIEKFVLSNQKPDYMNYAKISFNQFELLWHYVRKLSELKPIVRYLMQRQKFKKYDYESEVIVRRSIAAPFELELRQFKILFQKRFFSYIDEQDQFFVYPLHLEPEAATLISAIPYADQLATIKNIAFSLPFLYKLYVKEHPVAMGSRSDNFYRTLQKIPNVVLISPNQDVHQLIKKSSGVITLTGTMGLESVLAGKPAYVLGNVFYTYHPLCRKVQNFDDLKDRLLADLLKKPGTSDLESVNLRFMASYIRNTVEGNTAYAVESTDKNNYTTIVEAIRQRIGNVHPVRA